MAFVLIRWSKWLVATSPTSFVSPVSSPQTRAHTSVASLTSAAPWPSTTVCAPTSGWSQRVVRGWMTSGCGSQGTRHGETTHGPITQLRPRNWGGDQPAAPLTVMRAVCFRSGSRSVCLHVHDSSVKTDSHQHTCRHTAEVSELTGPRDSPFVCLSLLLLPFGCQ